MTRRGDWLLEAACRGDGQPDRWHDPRPAVVAELRQVCSGCRVASECLAFAMRAEAHTPGLMRRWGVWGGLDRGERYSIWQEQQKQARVVDVREPVDERRARVVDVVDVREPEQEQEHPSPWVPRKRGVVTDKAPETPEGYVSATPASSTADSADSVGAG